MSEHESRGGGGFTQTLSDELHVAHGCTLRVIEGPDAGRELDLGDRPFVVGTSKECDLRLSDGTVSSRHLEILVERHGIVVTDLGSKNGTYYLESRIDKAMVQRGAVLKLGRSRIVLASLQPPAGPDYSDRESYGTLLGTSPAMRRLYATLERLEEFDVSTLILGETGVGKEHVARQIHENSRVAGGPFEVCDCTALTPSLAESELFGHVRGAFTGATANYAGVFERAHGGTIFLDEVGDLPIDLQPKLLRVLETRTVRRVGSGESIAVEVRVIAATNRTLADDVVHESFRQDLFFRLNAVTIHVPPLRERREDIPLLIRAFLAEMGHEDLELSPATVELFTTGYDWPGNVRELRNAVTRAQIMGSLPEGMQDAPAEPELSIDTNASFRDAKRRIVDAFERDYLIAKMKEHDDNISRAARDAGMERNHLKRLLRKHGLME